MVMEMDLIVEDHIGGSAVGSLGKKKVPRNLTMRRKTDWKELHMTGFDGRT